MSFLTLAQAKPFILSSIYFALDDESNFEAIIPRVDEVIEEITGIEIPSDPETSNELTVPASYVLQKLAKNLLTELTPEFNAQIEKDYNFALELLKKRVSTENDLPDKSNSIIDELSGVDEW